MSTTTLKPPSGYGATASSGAGADIKTDPVYQAFWLLRIGFTVAPILFGIDKFANVLVNWEQYLAPWIRDLSPVSATHTMYAVG